MVTSSPDRDAPIHWRCVRPMATVPGLIVPEVSWLNHALDDLNQVEDVVPTMS